MTTKHTYPAILRGNLKSTVTDAELKKGAEFVPTGTICAFMHLIFHITSDCLSK